MIVLLFCYTGYSQQITLDTYGGNNTTEEYWYWSGGFPVIGQGFAPNSEVTVFATDPNGITWRNFIGTSDENGAFSIQISAKKIRSVLGQHLVTATDSEGNTATANLNVVANIKEVLNTTVQPAELTVSEMGNRGILIKCSGITPLAEVRVIISSPNASSSEIEPTINGYPTKYADENGNFQMEINLHTYSFPWGPDLPDTPGKWSITVHDWSNSNYGQLDFRIWPDDPNPSNYCTIQPQEPSEVGYPITSFEIVDVNSNTSSVNSTDYYEDFTSVVFNLNAGDSYTVRLKGKSLTSYAADTYTMFIDWNHNGVLDEQNEIVQEGYIFDSTGEDDKFTEFQFTVPENAINGDTRLRILKIRSTTTYSMFWPEGACGYYLGEGQVEDYTLNIEGGITIPECVFTNCPQNITLTAEPGANSAVVDYDLNVDCEDLNGVCEINYPGNGFGLLPISNPIVANDFDIPQGSNALLVQITANIARAAYSSSANIYFYEDNNGVPGALITSFLNTPYTSQTEVGSVGYPVFECVFDLPTPLSLSEGKYWLGLNVGGPLISWESTSNVSTEVSYTSFSSGESWEANDDNDGVFKIVYECAVNPISDTEIVLVQGLESGSQFPIGTTTVQHHLVYDGFVIDNCTFDVIIEAAAPTNCVITCPDDIEVNAESGQTNAVVDYQVGFQCETGGSMAELMLIEGLASGSVFPLDTTIVSYHLVYDDQVLSNCSFKVIVKSDVSVFEHNNSGLSVYPNPVTDKLNIDYANDISRVLVFDLYGRQVYSQEPDNNHVQLDLSYLANGIYFVKLETGNEVKSFRFLKD